MSCWSSFEKEKPLRFKDIQIMSNGDIFDIVYNEVIDYVFVGGKCIKLSDCNWRYKC